MTIRAGASIFPAMRILLFCALFAGCASQSKETPAAAATVMAGSMPSNAPLPEPKTTPEAGPAAAKPTVPGAAPSAASAASGPMTAAEAAATLSAQRRGGAGDGASSAGGSSSGAPSALVSSLEGDDGACATDADCTFTRAAPGACCPMLCTPRPVTKTAADALDEHMKSCARSHQCPQPSCRPPRTMTTPACVQSRCVAKVRDDKGMP